MKLSEGVTFAGRFAWTGSGLPRELHDRAKEWKKHCIPLNAHRPLYQSWVIIARTRRNSSSALASIFPQETSWCVLATSSSIQTPTHFKAQLRGAAGPLFPLLRLAPSIEIVAKIRRADLMTNLTSVHQLERAFSRARLEL